MPTWEKLRPWIDESMKALDCTICQLAVRAGIDEATLTRGYKSTKPKSAPRSSTLEALVNISPIPLAPFVPAMPWAYKPAPPPAPAQESVHAVEVSDATGDALIIEIRIKRRAPVSINSNAPSNSAVS